MKGTSKQKKKQRFRTRTLSSDVWTDFISFLLAKLKDSQEKRRDIVFRKPRQNTLIASHNG
jgi:hypothetical protein